MSPSSARTFSLQMLLVPLLWGSAFPLSKLGVRSAGPLLAANARFGLAALVAGCGLFLFRRRARLPLRAIPSVLLLAFLGVGAYNWCFFVGLQWAPSSDAALIVPVLSPIFTAVLAALFLHEELSPQKLSGLALALVGAAIFFWSVIRQLGGGQRLLGDSLFIVSSVSWSGYTLLGKRVMAAHGYLMTTAWSLVLGGVLIALSASPQVLSRGYAGVGAAFWLNMAYLAVFPSVAAYTIYYRGVSVIGATRAATFLYLVPVFATTISAALLGELLDLRQIVGGAVMLMGVVQVNWRASRSVAAQA